MNTCGVLLAAKELSDRKGNWNTYVLVGHLPVRSLPIRHHFPHHNPVAPDIAGRSEFAEGDGFWSCPSDWDFPSLGRPKKTKKTDWEKAAVGFVLFSECQGRPFSGLNGVGKWCRIANVNLFWEHESLFPHYLSLYVPCWLTTNCLSWRLV